MEILSFPGPIPPVDAEILEKNRRIVSRDYRNRRVGDFLKELHLTEGRGTGIPIIRDVMEQNGSPDPVFDTDDDSTYFLTVLYSHPELISDPTDQGSDQVTDQGENVTERQIQVLNLCVAPHSRRDILKYLELSNHQYNYQRHIKSLLEKDWLEMTLPEKPTSQNQKYKTTEEGRKILRKRNN